MLNLFPLYKKFANNQSVNVKKSDEIGLKKISLLKIGS